MLQKRRVVGTGTQRIDPQIVSIARFGPGFFVTVHHQYCTATLLQCDIRKRVTEILGNLVQIPLEHMAAADVHESATAAVRIEIGDGMFLQVIRMMFRPLCRTDQAGLLRIPGGINHSSQGPVSCACKSGDCFGLCHGCNHPGQRIGSTVIPAVMVIASNYPLIRVRAAFHARDHVISSHHVPVELGFHSHPRRARPEVIGDRQVAAPLPGHHFTIHRGQQRQRIAIGNRQHRNLRNGWCILPIQAACIAGCPSAGCQHIAGIGRHIHDRTPLHATFILERAFRIDVTGAVAVVGRIRIDNGTDSAFLTSQLRFDAAPGPAVLGNCDLARDVDAVALQDFIVLGNTVVDEHQFSFDFVIRWQQGVPIRRAGVFRQGIFVKPCAVRRWCDQLHFPYTGCG